MTANKFRCKYKANSCRKQENPKPLRHRCYACSYLEIEISDGTYEAAEDYGWMNIKECKHPFGTW